MNIAVYCGSNPGNNPEYSRSAIALGKWIGESGNTLVYGGSSVGLMGLVARETMVCGGEVYGVEPRFFIDAGVQQQDLTELIIVDTMGERKEKMIDLADVFVALPGGVGTLEEISEIFSRIRLNLSQGPCFCLNIDGFYTPLEQLLENMHEHSFIEHWDKRAYQFPKNVEDLIVQLASWEGIDGFDGTPQVPEKQVSLLFG